MALNILKLAVGCDSIADLEGWIEETRALFARLGRPYEQMHTTRMVPRRMGEILPGGSLYWVVKGQIACRQRLVDIRPFTDGEGIGRCQLVLEPVVHPVRPRPCRPFQGWRYLGAAEAPPDLGSASAAVAEMPDELRRELSSLGLL
jgi:hypothetical protein